MKDPFKVTVNEQFHFDATPEQAAALDVQTNGAHAYHLLQNGKAFHIELVESDFANRSFCLRVNGHRFNVHISDYYEQLVQKMGLNAAAHQKQNTVKAPMPGLVLDIMVQPGQAVEKGDTLLILEAMKMENVIKATGEGVVKAVHVEKGAAVEKGHLLIEL